MWSVRDRHRMELAELLGFEVGRLNDSARLDSDLGLDSLAKMSLLTWLADKVGLIGSADSQPDTVGEVLTLLDGAAVPCSPPDESHATATFARYYLEVPEFDWEQVSSGEGRHFWVEVSSAASAPTAQDASRPEP
jgi:acyl carrier protein